MKAAALFDDARSFWATASSALSQALENLDSEIRPGDDSGRQNAQNEQLVTLEADLDSYKKLLEDAQMQHFELSKQSRILVAERDAEIQHLKAKLVNGTAISSSVETDPASSSEASLKLQVLMSEKKVLEESLRELEAKLRESLSEKNLLLMMEKKHADLAARFDMMKNDYVKMKADFEVRDRERTETIENLVSEYSKLAAEAELMQTRSTSRINEVIQENEVLVTRLHALEHSINELAERASASSMEFSHSEDHSQLQVVQQELKEARAKIVNLQFDLKERENEVKTLQQKQQAAPPAPPSPARDSVDASKLASLEQECGQLTAEVNRSHQEVETLRQEVDALRLAAATSAAAPATVEVVKEIQEVVREVEKVVVKEVVKEVPVVDTAVIDALRLELQALQQQKQLLQEQLEAAQSEKASVAAAKESVALERAALAEKLVALEESKARLEKEKSSVEEQLSATMTSGAQDKDVLVLQMTQTEQKLRQCESDLAEALAKAAALQQACDTYVAQAVVAGQQISALEEEKQSLQAQIAQLQQQHAENVQSLQAERSQAEQELRAESARQLASAQTEWDQATVQKLQEQQALLLEQNRQEQAALSQTHAAQQSEALAALRSALDSEHEQALTSKVAELTASHTAATEALAAEQAQALERLREEHQGAMHQAEQQHQQAVQQLTASFEQQLAEQRNAVTQLQQQLAVIQERSEAEKAAALESQRKLHEEALQKALADLRTELNGAIQKAYAERDEHLANYTKERKLRKKLHNKIQDIQGNIRVLCRVRPILPVEVASGQDADVTDVANDEELYIQRDAQTKTKYEYDRVFGQKSTQEEVFEAVQGLCISVLDGYNVCIFAYGQTGSGKTFTMEGYGENIGVSPRAIMELFNQVAELVDYEYVLTFSMLEIYNETIRDLLDGKKDKDKLEVRQTSEGNTVIGLTEVTITSMEQVRELMQLGQTNRAVGSHDMNEHSSRSHSILTVTARGRNKVDNSTTFGKLHLIDLAGSERVGKTDATGDRLKEAQNINKSLLALGDVINALGNKKSTHVPYRNSKLTFLLQDSLGGNSKVMTFVNISPAAYNLGETICSLNFASRCRSTELGQAKKQTGTASESSSGAETPKASSAAASARRPGFGSSTASSLNTSLHSSASMSSLVSPAVTKR